MALPEVPFSVLTQDEKTTKQTMMKVVDGRTQNMIRSIDIFQQGPQVLCGLCGGIVTRLHKQYIATRSHGS